MKFSHCTGVAGLVAATAACVLGIGVVPSLADPANGTPETLTLAAPSSPPAGQPFIIQATGNDPTDSGALYLEIDEIPGSVTSTCPSGYLSGAQLAANSGGSFVSFDQRENYDASGNFSVPNAFKPSSPGTYLMCGYTDDGATNTLASYTLPVTVSAANSSPGPSNTPSNTPTSTFNKALAKCAHLKGAKKSACITRARLARALAQCKQLSGSKARSTCAAKARRRYRVK